MPAALSATMVTPKMSWKRCSVTFGHILTRNSNVGTINEPMHISFLGTEGGLYVYPSPFHSQLKIRANVDRNAQTDVFVSDMSGKRVVAWDNCNDNGNVDITWNAGNTVPSGVYIVSISVDGNVYSMKAIKK